MNQELIDKLVVLQETDLKIRELTEFCDRIPKEIDTQQKELTQQEESFLEYQHNEKHKQLKIKEKNGVLKSNEEQIQKLRILLNAAKSNKEYDTIKMQINKLDKENHLMEEEILVMMEEADTGKTERNGMYKEFEAAKKQFEVVKKENDAKLTDVKSQLKNLSSQRNEQVKQIAPQALSKYERIRKAVGGNGIVNVNNGVCSGCHSGLPPQLTNDIVRLDELVLCEYCSRILYVKNLKFD